MGNRFRNRNNTGNRRIRAKLSFDQGFAENPIYTIKCFTNEKIRGIDMIVLIKNNFDMTEDEIVQGLRKDMDKWKEEASQISMEFQKNKVQKTPIIWTRDEKGNIISPYRSKKIDIS